MLNIYFALLLFVYLVAGSINFEGHDVSCLSSCLSSNPLDLIDPNSSLFSVDDFCTELLSTAYFSCNSFDISTARCHKEAACRNACSIEDWCYFGVGMLSNCPGDEWYPLAKRALSLQEECVSSEYDMVNITAVWLHDDDHVEFDLEVPKKNGGNKTFHKVVDRLFDGNDSWSIDRVAVLCKYSCSVGVVS